VAQRGDSVTFRAGGLLVKVLLGGWLVVGSVEDLWQSVVRLFVPSVSGRGSPAAILDQSHLVILGMGLSVYGGMDGDSCDNFAL
jgi:hypothetical protein